jgi:ABC-type spermidine/putrescine transport system permease subunit I
MYWRFCFIYMFFFVFFVFIILFIFSPSTAHNSSTSFVRTHVTSTKYYSELSDDDLQSEATNASVSETLNGGGNSTIRNSAAGDFNNGNH